MEDIPRREPLPGETPAFGPDDDPWAEPLPPPGGAHGTASDGPEMRCVGFCPICRGADVIRASAPPEFQEHWQSFQREFLLAARALIEHHLQTMERQGSGSPPAGRSGVEDIPID